MYKEWEKVAANVGLTLVFTPFYDEEEIAYVHKDECGDGWIIDSDLLGKDRDTLCDAETEAEVKTIVEKMVEEYYEEQMEYYSELLKKFKE